MFGYDINGSPSLIGEKRGIIPRAIEKIFIDTDKMLEKGWHIDIMVEFCEIYMEQIIDLLKKDSSGLQRTPTRINDVPKLNRGIKYSNI